VSVWKIGSPQIKRKKNRLGAYLIWCNSSWQCLSFNFK